MKDFGVEITVRLQVSARNQDQADERAAKVTEWMTIEAPKQSQGWVGTAEYEVTSVEEAT